MNYFSGDLGIRNIPNFIVAQTPAGLRRKMRSNNIFQGGYVDYFDFQQTKDGKWIVWYVIGLKEAIKDDEQVIRGD